jgi:hypothetical protein
MPLKQLGAFGGVQKDPISEAEEDMGWFAKTNEGNGPKGSMLARPSDGAALVRHLMPAILDRVSYNCH